MAPITNAKAAKMIEHPRTYAAKYRLLALNESDQLMVRLFEENALWLEGEAERLQRAGNLLNDALAQNVGPTKL